MQKLKKVFSPGNDKDDEMMYGTPRKSADNSHSQSDTVGRSSSGSATNQSPTSPSQTKEDGTTRQVISPDADKYDEQRFGKSASGTEPQSSKAANDREALLASQSAQEDKSVKRQVLHPESNKHDETGFGTTGFTGKDAQDTKATSSRPNELGSVPPSNDRYTSETTAAPGSAFTTDRQAMPPTTDSRMSMKSGVVGSPDQRTTDRALGSDGITDDGTSAPKQDQSSSNFSRNAALAGAGAAAGAGGAYAATRQRRTSRTSGDPEIEEATYTDRSFPLRGGTNSSHLKEDRPASSVYSNDAAGPSSTSAYIDPSTSSSTQKDAGGLGYGSGSAAVAGAGAGAVGAAATKEKLADHSKHSHVFHGDPCKDGPHSPADKTLPHVPGPHNTVAANLEDPHVPGEFPSEDGTDPHGNDGAGGLGRSSRQQQPPLLASTRPGVSSGSSYPMQTSPSEKSSNEHHTALAAGGVGAAGLGAYAATRDRGNPTEQTSSREVASSTQQPQTSSAAHTQTPQQVAGDPVTGAREPEKEHHYGRNAGYAGGAGAAGAAAYTAYQRSQDRDGAVPSSQDPVSRDSNVGGLGDIQRRDVTDSTAPKDEKEHHYGRNAGLAGATGAAGYGAYQYGKDRGDNNVSSKADDPYDTYRDAADPKTQPETTRHAAPTETRTAGPTKTEQYTTQQPQSQSQQQTSPPQEEEHHYGRNAALAGGAGAAGAAGYSALQSDRGDTGPASKTIGPHESNVANILDPRVRPEPEKMKDHTTAGPWQSDTLNKLDPKVESNPEKADVKAHGYASGVAPQSMSQQQQQQQRAAPGEEDKDHHYGRNAALAGGAAGAGAAAGYGASQAYEQRTQPEGLSEKEQEKLAKQQEKQAKHDTKEQQKQAEHDADEAAKAQKKEQEKAAKEAEKEREKKAKELEKEQKKADKQHAKEEEKAEKARAKEAERAEKEHAKEQEKLDKERESEDSALAAARQEEAERKHNEHNKLHKTPPEEREKKGGILHRIFHHKAHDREGAEGGERQSGSFEEGERAEGLEGDETGRARGAAALDGSGGAGGDSLGELRQGDKVGEGFGQQGGSRDSGIVTEKSTGLPMNVGKYGSGAGGTDAGEHIHGYQGEAR